MTNRFVKYPRGIIEDFLDKIEKFVYLIEFVALVVEEDGNIPIILGRLFECTTCTLIDIHESKLMLRVGYEKITFGTNQTVISSQSSDNKVFFMDCVDEKINDGSGMM